MEVKNNLIKYYIYILYLTIIMEPISLLGMYLSWVVVGSGILYYYAETQSENIYNRLERHLKR